MAGSHCIFAAKVVCRWFWVRMLHFAGEKGTRTHRYFRGTKGTACRANSDKVARGQLPEGGSSVPLAGLRKARAAAGFRVVSMSIISWVNPARRSFTKKTLAR